MSAKSIRIFKEARSLFWPWLVVVLAGVLRLAEPPPLPDFYYARNLFTLHNFIEPLSFLGFFIGIPLLATLSLGNEFQHRTLSLLLSQPIRRMEIWGEKFSVTIIAVVSAALIFCWTWRSAFHQDRELWIGATALILIMTASAPFWTLVARSTMGGLALNSVNSFIPLLMTIRRDWIPQTTITRSFAVLALLCYAGAMLWLGRRRLARFELTGGIAGDDLLTSGPDFLPKALANWFRSRPTGAVLNLIRKEFRLLRPVWLISLLAVPAWMSLPLFGHISERESLPAFIMALAFTPLIAVLAGALSLGEERTLGTHSLHLTLPVSSSRQWLIKLAVAMFTSLVCAALFPILSLIASNSIFGPTPLPVDSAHWFSWLLPVSLLTFASFWCACTVNGTVRAALCVFPALIALLFAGQFGDWVGLGLFQSRSVDIVISKIHFFANFRFTNALSNLPMVDTSIRSELLLVLLLIPAVIVALIQSRSLFRKLLQDRTLFVIRRLLPLAITAFLTTFLLIAPFALAYHARRSMWTMFKETHDAIDKLQPGVANVDPDHPLQLTVEDLEKVSPLSERTQRWLRNSRITVTTDEFRDRRRNYCSGKNCELINLEPDKPYPWYSATIHLPSGSVCTMFFESNRRFGVLGGVCK